MFGWRNTTRSTDVSRLAAREPEACEAAGVTTVAIRDTSDTRRAARTALLSGIGSATEANLALGKILRDAFALVGEIAAFSPEFDATAESTRAKAEQFVATVCQLQSQSDVVEERLTKAAGTLADAHAQSRSAMTSVEDLTRSINDIERIIKMIAGIATQTNLLALNATIEAARAGAAGAGFRVVAGEVKELSQQTQRAADEIVASVKRIRDRALVNMAEVKSFDQTVESMEDVFEVVRASVETQGEKTRQIGFGSDQLAGLAQNVRLNAARMQALGGSVKSMTDLAEMAALGARDAFALLTERAAIVLRHGDGDGEDATRRWPIVLPATAQVRHARYAVRVIDLSAEAAQIEIGADFPTDQLGETISIDAEDLGGFDAKLLTPTTSGYECLLVDPRPEMLARIAEKVGQLRIKYRPYIERVCAIASTTCTIMEACVASGALSMNDLFDTDYRRDGSTEPASYWNASVGALEARLRSHLDGALDSSPTPDFCLVQDRNGFNPVHNSKYSHPARAGDVVWNLRHARAHRIFDDRVGIAASRNLKPYIVQSYARDMGDAIEIRMEFDAPVFVQGRHWGTVRMAYKLAEDTMSDRNA